ncbi:MAG: prolyl oligopeptidase family serine peptidase [Methyloprofundus sp.]|nr:prolyl oligopeptidase family serine peptidase [Methyloprofundus sp.]
MQEFNIENQALGKVLYQHPEYDLLSADISKAGELHSVSYSEHGLSKRQYFDKGSVHLAKKLANTFKNKEAYFVEHSPSSGLHLLYVNGSDEPGEYFIYRDKDGRLNRLLNSYPELAGQEFSPTQTILAKSKDGTDIEAFLTLATDLDYATLLVMPHGGPIGIKEDDSFNKEVQYYASRGFSVLRVNFRGSSGFGKKFQEQGVGQFGRLIEEDITTIVKQVRKKYDFKYMCSIGSSYGGYSAAMLAIKHPEQYDCVIGAFGIYDLPLLFNTSNYRSSSEHRKNMAKTVGKYSLSMTKFSPLYLYKKLKAPILLIAGKDDDIADFEHSNRFNYILNRTGHPVETMFYNNTGHGHPAWFGNKHEAAITSDYLMRILNLKLPDIRDLNKNGITAIANDFMNIADGYSLYSKVINSPEKAFQYYKLAANYKHPRAIFNIGAYYQEGKQVKKDMDKALEFYQKSAELGSAQAYGQLGKMYMEGNYLAQDWEKAYENLIKAQEIEPIPFNNIRLARFYCTAPSQYKDVEKCIQLMDLKQYKDHSQARLNTAEGLVRSALAWIIIDAHLSRQELNMVKSFASKLYELNRTEVSIEGPEEGAFKYKVSKNIYRESQYRLISSKRKLAFINDELAYFGVIFEIDVPGLNRLQDRVAVAVRWTKTDSKGLTKQVQNIILYGMPSRGWRLLREFKEVKGNEIWQLEIFDLDQNRIYQKKFDLTYKNTATGENA